MGKEIILLLLFLVVAIYEGGGNDLDYLQLLDDRLMYRIAYKSADEFPEELEEAKEKLVQITSPSQEQYQCLIPTINTYSKKRIESYTGPTPAQLLQPIYDEHVCSYKFEAYWNYELCHGRYLLQYHEEKEIKKRTEYYLGNFVGVSAAMEARNFDQLSPPTKKIGEEMRAYYPVTYTHGTVCDITGKPRQTMVLYVCDEDARQNIYSFAEVSSCHYEIVVLSSELCAHPAFQVIPHKEHEISCFPINKDPEEDPKPKALLKIEDDTENQFVQEYGLFKDVSSAKTAKQVFSKLFQVEEEVIEDGFKQLNNILESIKKAAAQNNAKPAGRASLASKEQQHRQPQLTEIQKVVQGFWRGGICLHGGTGWWKYEVCHGKTVNQYHQEAGKPRQNILLGVFDREVHKAWAIEHPEKVVERNSDGRIMQVSNLYTQGDICEEKGAHRSCEVRMRCRDDIAAQKVFIYMIEPSTCQYIVVLESPLFCGAFQNVDKYGLFPEDGGDIDEHRPNIDDEGGMEERESKGDESGENSNVVKGVRKGAAVEIGLINQEEIMRIVQNLVQGMNDGQVTVDITKIKIPLDRNEDERSAEENGQTEKEAANEEEEEESGPEMGKREDDQTKAEEERLEGGAEDGPRKHAAGSDAGEL